MATIIKEVLLNASPSRVWKAITDAEEMKNWYFDMPAFKPEIGYEFRFESDCEGHINTQVCKVLEVIVNKKLKYSWAYIGNSGISYVCFELSAEENKTRLKLTHEGVDSFAKDDPSLHFAGFDEGWTEIIEKNLESFIEKALV